MHVLIKFELMTDEGMMLDLQIIFNRIHLFLLLKLLIIDEVKNFTF